MAPRRREPRARTQARAAGRSAGNERPTPGYFFRLYLAIILLLSDVANFMASAAALLPCRTFIISASMTLWNR